MKKNYLFIVALLFLSCGCGVDSTAETPQMTGIRYHIYSSATYGADYADKTTSATCPDTMQAISAGCNCRPTRSDLAHSWWPGLIAIEAQYLSNNAANCDCEYSEGLIDSGNEVRTEVAYVTCADIIYNNMTTIP